MSTPPPAPGDGGVIARLRRRTRMVALFPALVAALLAGSAWAIPGWATSAGSGAIALLACAALVSGALLLIRRVGRWQAAAAAAADWVARWQSRGGDSAVQADEWVGAVCGEPKPMHTGKALPVVRRERRLPAVVLPLRAGSGVLAQGQAVIVHARGDGALPAAGDALQVRALGYRGPYLIGRASDGVVFAADRWMIGVG